MNVLQALGAIRLPRRMSPHETGASTSVQGISWSGVIARIVLVVPLVLATYNPSGQSFYHWLAEPPAGITAVKAQLGCGSPDRSWCSERGRRVD